MSWRDRLEPGSFRDVPFFVDVGQLSGGRRTAVHEYPMRDTPYAEDLGRKARTFSFDCYVVGPDYIDARNALLDALEQAGPGELVHPLHGLRRVICTDYAVRESRSEGGFARFSLAFVEAGHESFPSSLVDHAAAVSAGANGVLDAAGAALEDGFSVAGLPQWAVDRASSMVTAAAEIAEKALGPMRATYQAAAKIRAGIVSITTRVDALVRSPGALVQDFRNLLSGFADGSDDRRASMDALDAIYRDLPGDRGPTTTATRERAEDNRQMLRAYIQQAALAEMCRLAPGRAYESVDEALAVRDTLADRLDAQAEAAADDDLFAALLKLRGELVQAVPGDAMSLPRLVTVERPATVPAIVLAYDLYEDASRAAEIIARNRIRHPLFVPGGRPIQVASRE